MWRKLFNIFLIIILLNTLGCSKLTKEINIEDFSISYLERIDSKYLVGNKVSISAKVLNAKNVQLIIQDNEQNKVESTIEGKKSGHEWLFEYENNDLFTKTIWVTANSGKDKIISEKKIITNIDENFENVFENILPINPESVNLLKQKIHLDIIGWLDNSQILAKDNDSLFLYDISKNLKDIILKDVWNIFVNHNIDKVIYQVDDGIHFYSILDNKTEKIFDVKEGMTLKDLVWSKGDNDIIISIIEDNREYYYLINLFNNTIKSLEFDNKYEIDTMLYLDNNYLFAFGKLKPFGEKNENDSYHLLDINIVKNDIKDYTPNIQQMDNLTLLCQINNEEFLIRISTSTISEDDISTSNDIYVLNTKKKTLTKHKIEIEFPYVISFYSDKNQYIYLSNTEDDNDLIYDEKMIILGINNKEEEMVKTFRYYPNNFYWSKDGSKIVFYINNSKEIYLMEKAS